jgi:hypothetical protein
MTEKAKTGLDLLREPFPAHQISKLPKPTKQQTDALKAAMDKKDFSLGIRCQLCGAWHHKDVVHLDYVGHAALTDRLLDADPDWTWEPVAFRDGLPAFDQTGGLWIKLTVCGVTRLGYGHAAGKPNQDPGAREKEVIGDALRNAAMRFGAALDLWHKGDLHGDADGGDAPVQNNEPAPASKPASKADSRAVYDRLSRENRALASQTDFDAFWAKTENQDAAKSLPADWKQSLKSEKDDKAAELAEAAKKASEDDPFNERNAA